MNKISRDFSLKDYNTFGIDVNAREFVSVGSTSDLKELLQTHDLNDIFILGGGSNLLLTNDINKLVVHVNLKGRSVVSESNGNVIIEVMAGENWHELVLWCLDQGFGGIENLSLIPGNTGTAPIQNIGAYGVELKDVFVSCDALNLETGELITFEKEACNFDYRNSIFKEELKGKVIICSVRLQLTTTNHKLNTSYGAIEAELQKRGITKPGINDISEAVITIRKSKLPDPKDIGNSGSFFKNPVISTVDYNKLKENFHDIPSYPASEYMVKVPAGWLIEKAGFKGKRFGDYGVHKKQALVLVNYGNARGQDIRSLSELIQETVKRLFDIKLEAEVNII